MLEAFHVLRDPWIPVWIDEQRTLVSLEQILTGECEKCTDIAHSRDEFRAFSYMLASALVQALFEPASLDEMRERLRTPLRKEEFLAAISPFEADFDLLGNPGFLQYGERTDDNLTTALLHEFSETHRPALLRDAVSIDGLCPACATVALYGMQAFAASGGRGSSPSVRGSPPLTTFVRAANLRQTLWANVYVRAGGSERYPKEEPRPWTLGPTRVVGGKSEQYRKNADEIGLVEGLFWKPRSIRLAPSSEGVCGLCLANGPRVRACCYGAGARKEDGYFAHPHSPSRFFPAKNEGDESQRATQHIPNDRPVWTGLADLLPSVRRTDAKSKEAGGASTQAAPVVFQWTAALHRPLELLVFAYRFDNASIEGRLFLSYPSLKRAGDSSFQERIAKWVEDAEGVLAALLTAFKQASGDRKTAFWADAARSEFWRSTEPLFWNAVRSLDEEKEPDSVMEQLAKTARSIFNAHTEPAELEAKAQATIVRARKNFNIALKKLIEGPKKPEQKAKTTQGANA